MTSELDSPESGAGFFTKVNPNLQVFGEVYWQIHPYTSLMICTFGIITNLFNIITLTRPHMRNSINCILTGIAVSDIITMTSYVPFVIHFYLQHNVTATPERKSYGWMMFLSYNQMISIATHVCSIWLAVFLAILRYRCIQSNITGGVLTLRSTLLCTVLIWILSFALTLPSCVTYIVHGLTPIYGPACNYSQPTNDSVVCYNMYSPSVGSTNPKLFDVAVFWLYALVGKLIPCCLITTFGALLLRTLNLTRRRSEQLVSRTNATRMRQHSRTTKMLLAVIVMFLVTELPQGIATVMGGSIDGFLYNVYTLIGDFLDLLSLVNNSVNFILYCTMSQQYRQTFVQLMCPKFVLRQVPPNNTPQTETIALRSHVTNGPNA